MARYQVKGVVTRALTRDTGLRNADHTRPGHHVRGGGDIPVTIYADVSDSTMDSRADRSAAAGLAEALAEKGWDVRLDDTRVIVMHAPTVKEQRGRGFA